MRMSIRNRCRDRRGITLVLTLFALVVLGAAVSASFLVTRFDRSGSSHGVWAVEAQNAAESGLARTYATWDPAIQNLLPVWSRDDPTEWNSGPIALQSGKLYHNSTIRRLNQELFQVTSTGWRQGGGRRLAELSVVQFFRLAKPTIDANAAVTVSEPIKFNGNAFEVSGLNSNPPQWNAAECDALDPGNSDDVVGVRSATGTGVGSKELNNVFGYPEKEVSNDASITSATFNDFLDYTFATLGSQPGVKLLPNTTPYNGVAPVLDLSSNTCDKSALLNFGEPYRPPTSGVVVPCQSYFPVVRGTGSQTKFAAGSRGQGVLLIDGNLELAGGFQWVGLIIVRNEIKINGNGNKIYGALLAEGASVGSDNGSISGNVEVHYSNCAIEKAVFGAATARPLGQRSWSQTF